jgi:hypothetical protein
MTLPELVRYDSIDEYRSHYRREYCQSRVETHDGIRVFFKPDSFDHMFYESSNRDGKKDCFSRVRAERIDWIRLTLEHPGAAAYQGWLKSTRSYDAARKVAVVYEDFVVVISLRLDRQGGLRADFVTCYQADNSIGKIRSAPAWTTDVCIEQLKRRAQKSR